MLGRFKTGTYVTGSTCEDGKDGDCDNAREDRKDDDEDDEDDGNDIFSAQVVFSSFLFFFFPFSRFS